MFGRDFPILQTDHGDFSNATMSSCGLEGLAQHLVSAINMHRERDFKGDVEIDSSVPTIFQKYSPGVYQNFPDSLKRTFEEYMPERIKIKWVKSDLEASS